MRYQFTKMQSLGNDFIVLDGVSARCDITPDIARRLADRHFGVGCDQVLVVHPADDGDDGVYGFQIFNADGGEVGQCGNGARCIARFMHDRGWSVRTSDRHKINVRTVTTAMELILHADETVTAAMGVPEFAPAKIPFQADAIADTYELALPDARVTISALAIGNPHAVQQVADIARAPVATHGAQTESHPRFPARVNAGFMHITARDRLDLRVYERGVGETLGCGSGACAAVAAGVRLGLLDECVTVALPGGEAEVRWAGVGEVIYLRGSAEYVFEGEVELG